MDYASTSSVTAEDHHRLGRDALVNNEAATALEHFRSAHQIDRANPRYRSYYGLALALVERRFDRALELCRSAAKEEFFNPDLYHNLAPIIVGKLMFFLWWGPYAETVPLIVLRIVLFAAVTWGLTMASWKYIETPLQGMSSKKT